MAGWFDLRRHRRGGLDGIGNTLNIGFVAVEAYDGWKRAGILAAFINALLLLVAMGSLAWEAAHRLQTPQAVEGVTIWGWLAAWPCRTPGPGWTRWSAC
jgi:hypothetical protein